jgi:hypothetical protein
MANKKNRTNLSKAFRFSGTSLDKPNFDKRRVLNLLPGVNQTETMQKFFGASADHLFEPGASKPLNGYIGRSVSYTEEGSNFYLTEETSDRQFYQLEPSMVSIDENNANKALLFYDDLINSLRFQGGLVNNHHRLFSQDYFSWAPSIDLDKFLNFREYYWIPEGPTTVELRGHAAKYIGDAKVRVFSVTQNYPTPSIASQVSVTVDGIEVPFTYNSVSGQVALTPPPAKDSIIKVYSALSLEKEIVGKETLQLENDILLESNLRVLVKNDKNADLIGKTYIVEGVGEYILTVDDADPDLTLKKDYIVIQRGSSDGNDWSTKNRWFHKNLLGDKDKDLIRNAQAKRPIIEFTRNIQLFNFGSTKRKPVDLVSHSAPDFMSAVNGQLSSTKRIDGVILTRQWIEENSTDGSVRILVVNDDDARITNRVYRVTFNSVTSKLKAVLVADGADVSGSPTLGESVDVRLGSSLGGTNLHWDGNVWKSSQRKTTVNQFPLFYVYDANGVAFDDTQVYPNSTFQGSRLFGYREDSTLSSPVDSALGLRLVYDTKGEILFENYLATQTYTYRVGVDLFDLPEKRFYKIAKPTGEVFVNDWYKVGEQSRQMVVDKFVAAKGYRLFQASQEPIEPLDKNLEVYRNNTLQTRGSQYIQRNNQILFVELEDNDEVEIRTFNPSSKPMNSTGHYEIPLNLEANPKWEQITYAARGDLFEQFISIMRRQVGFTGLEYSINNWKDLKHDLSLGAHIVSHTAPLLRTMLLSSSKDLDFTKAVSYAQDEYARFRGKFDQKIKEFFVTNKLGASASASQWVDLALEEIAKGFTNDFPFFYSKVGNTSSLQSHNFIPPSPSFLGIYPIQEPSTYTDPVTGTVNIIGHDGSSFPIYGDFRDAVTLELEQRIYDSAPDYVREKESGFFDLKGMVSTKFYEAEYTISELNTILRPMFEKWAVNFGIDYRVNDSFDANDPFTWNWRSCVDSDNRFLPGHWRGIYQFYYGTDRPHTHPWEMLGFEYQPSWWESQYGKAPYGSDNVLMWRDIEAGRIADGPTAGTYARYAKPKLLNWLPVDSQGNLLDPLAAKITNQSPRSTKSSDEWVWGDGAPAESAWKQSFWFPFAMAQAAYLMKPPAFIEATWDIERNLEANANLGYGFPYADEYVHSELLFDGTIAYRHGSQQWVVDYLKSKNKDVTENLGSLIRGLDAKLAYKVGGFTESDSLFVVSDNIDRLPPEDVSVELYKSPSIREEFLGGVLVRKVANGWKLFGYDILDPVFKIIPSDPNSKSVNVSAGQSQRTRIPTWHTNTYYPQNTTVRYLDKYYRCLKTHTSSRSFEVAYWVEVARPVYADASAVEYYLNPKNQDVVERIPYGSLIKTAQEMATFLSGYERYIVSRGWVFEQVASDESSIYDWKLSLKDFLAWAQDESVSENAMLALIPNSSEITFATDHGNVEPIEQIVNGVYSILDKVGNPIKAYNTNVVRDGGKVTIQTRSGQEMYAVRLHISEYEHVIITNNTTIFGDIVYSPLFNIRQARLRLQGFKTKNWKGRIDAPGFLVNGNKLTVNFEKAADDFRRLFDVESIENSNLKDRARANIGYQEKEYLSNLLMTPTNQFEFHQGMIQQKGTISAMRKLFRSNFVRGNEDLNVLEEWGFRIGEYGSSEIKPSMDFLIKQGDFKNSPQMFQFNGSGQGGWDLKLAWDMDHWDYLKTNETIRSTYSINGIKRINLVSKGAGYQEAPVVRVVGESNGASLEAILDWNNSGIAEIKVLKGGEGFFKNDVIEIDGTGVGATAIAKSVDFASSKLTSAYIIPLNGSLVAGQGYKVGDEINVTGGNGNGKLEVTQIDTNGGILALGIKNPGAGYESVTTFGWPTGNASADGRIGVKVSGGRLMLVEITNSGQGYDPTASVRFTGTGRGAVLELSVTGASISGVNVVARGGGFETIPQIEFVGGDPTTPASATALLQDPQVSGLIEIAKFKKRNGIILKSFTVKVLNEFNGVQPLLTIGDQTDNARYVGEINLALESAKTYVLDDGQQIGNSEYEIQGFVTNAQDSGNLEITFSFEYTPTYYTDLLIETDDENVTKIFDLFNNETNEFMHKDERWVWRHDSKNPDWPLISLPEKQKGNLPSAGYTHLDDIQWTATNTSNFNALYRRMLKTNPSTALTNSVDIKYVGGATGTRRVNIVPNLSQGMYRVKNFIVDIKESFSLASDNSEEVKISIGTIDKPESYMPATAVHTNVLQTYTHQIFEYMTAKQNDENALYVFVTQASGLAVAPGSMTITANLELIGDIVVPGDRTWVYDMGNGDWDIFRLGDTHANVAYTRPQSFTGQGTVISTTTNMFDSLGIDHNPQEPRPTQITLNPTFDSDIAEAEARMDRVILDGILPDNNTTEMLLNTYKAKFKNSAKIFIDANTVMKSNGSSLIQIPIMDMYADSGIVINKITASVVRPFTYPAGQNPTLTIGTLSDSDRFIGAVNSTTAYRNVLGTPARPNFTYSSPITLDVYDTTMVLNEQDATANVRLLRSGNVFVTPSAITVTNSGWGYSDTSNPKVTILGPTGVKATAHLEGVIIGYAVTDAGEGYTSVPTITIVGGGGGTGAKGQAVMADGKITAITIPGTGSGTATAVLSGSKVGSLNVVGATGWEMDPIVTFEGGGATTHAAVTVTRTGTDLTGFDIAFGGIDYTSVPTVKLNPTTGAGYTIAPRVLISGGGGQGASAEPIMLWRVKSISIDSWGKCSWVGGDSSVTVEAPNGGAPAQAILESTPTTLEPTSFAQWRYRVVGPTSNPNYGTWVYSSNPVTFPAPTGTNGPDFYLQSVSLPIPLVDEATTIEVDFPEYVIDTTTGLATTTLNVVNGVWGTATNSVITINNTLAGSRDIDLKVQGTVQPFYLNERINTDAKMVAFYNGSGVTDGLITIVVDYSYTNGFELFTLADAPVTTSITGAGGDIFAWNSVRYSDIDDFALPQNKPVDSFVQGDRILMDDGRSTKERASDWKASTAYAYHDMVRVDGIVYRAIQSGSGLTATIAVKDNDLKSLDRPVITDRGTLYTHEPTITITGDGHDAAAHVTLAPTGIYRIKVLNASSNAGYTGNEKLLITPKNLSGKQAEARITKMNGTSIVEVTVTAAGWGYDAAPIVTVVNDTTPLEQRVQFECVMIPVRIKDIVMENRGSDYTSATLSFTQHGVSTDRFKQNEWEVAFEKNAVWKVLQLGLDQDKNPEWQDLRVESTKIDSSMIDSAVIYDVETSETLQTLQLYDPYKGYIPGAAKREISYILEYDPAIYSNGPLAKSINSNEKLWDSAKVGDIWWDISTTRYLDYEIGDTDYKWANWGKLCPGITIDIYEWTRSTVTPSLWANEVEKQRKATLENDQTKPTGVVKNVDTASWVERQEFNNTLGRNETIYYFWVKNAASLPFRPDRNLTAVQIAALIQDPNTADIPWFAIIDTNKVIVGGAKSYVNDHSSSLKITWKKSKNDGLVHKQWKLLREEDERNNIDESLWNKMRDSLVGWDNNTQRSVFTSTLTSILDPTSTSFTVADASQFDPSGEVKIGDYWVQYSYLSNNTFMGVSGLGNLRFGVGTKVQQTRTVEKFRKVPDQWLNERERYGSLTRPAQTWFRADTDDFGFLIPGRSARKTFVETMNNIFTTEPFLDTRYEWRELFEAEEPQPDATTYFSSVADEFERDQLAATNSIKVGQKILMQGTPDTNGLWTLWIYLPDDARAISTGFVLQRAQRYRMRDGELWTSIDWYDPEWSANDYPVKRYSTLRERDKDKQLDTTLLRGTLVQVDQQSETDTRWAWYIYQDDAWRLVAKQKGTIRLNDNFYASGNLVYGFDDFKVGSSKKRDGSWEIQFLLTQLRSKMFTALERNELFFSMVKAAIAEHSFNDWVFKTSFLYMAGYNEQLTQSPITFKDQMDSILSYLNDVKPYHVKIRDFVRRLSPPIEMANFGITDFDKPLWWDETLNQGNGAYRKLDVSNPVDMAIMKADPQLKWYANNFEKTNYDQDNWNENWNPIRHPNITMLFDRVACQAIVGWSQPEVPWDGNEQRWNGTEYTQTFAELEALYRIPGMKYEQFIFASTSDRDQMVRDSQSLVNQGLTATLNRGDVAIVRTKEGSDTFIFTGESWIQFFNVRWDQNYAGGLADRINEFYEPSATMRRKELKTLIRGCDFRGTVVDGSTLENGLWDMFEWDSVAGWDNEFDYYIGRDVELNPTNNDWSTGGASSEDINIEGSEFDQPWFAEGHPDELARIKIRNPLTITVYRRPTVQGDMTGGSVTALRFHKDSNDTWNGTFLEEDGLQLASALETNAKEVHVVVPGTFMLHDPSYQTNDTIADKTAYAEMLRNRIALSINIDLSVPVKKNTVLKNPLFNLLGLTETLSGISGNPDVRTQIAAHIDDALARNIEGVVWIGTERITYAGVTNNNDGTYTLTGLTRGTAGTPRTWDDTVGNMPVGTPVYDGSVLNSLLTYNVTNMRTHSIADYSRTWKSWITLAQAGTPGPTA